MTQMTEFRELKAKKTFLENSFCFVKAKTSLAYRRHHCELQKFQEMCEHYWEFMVKSIIFLIFNFYEAVFTKPIRHFSSSFAKVFF